MKIIVMGGSGLIGSKVVQKLTARGHAAVAASPSAGVDSLTGAGLDAALTSADALIDVTNSPSFADDAVLTFFQTSTRNPQRAGAAARVRHYVALSVVGAERLPESGYMRAKAAQEALTRSGGIPYTIVRATQFYEFLGPIADSGSVGGTVWLPPVRFQPMAAEDVASALTEVVLGGPLNGVVEVAGPEMLPMDEFLRRYLLAKRDSRPVVADPEARYFGARLQEGSLVPEGAARLDAPRAERMDPQRRIGAAGSGRRGRTAATASLTT